MRNTNAAIALARRRVKSNTTQASDNTIDAILGDANGQVDAGDGYHWVRRAASADENDNSTVGAAFRAQSNPAGGYYPGSGRRVKLERRGNEWRVKEGSHKDMLAAGINPSAGNPMDPYNKFIYLDQIVDLNAYEVSPLKIAVREWNYRTADNEFKVWRGTNASTHYDLTPHIPGSANQQCYGLLVFNITEHLASSYPIQVYTSTPITTLGSVLGESDLQECYSALPTDEIIVPIKAYALVNGMSRVRGVVADLHVRQLINIPSLGSGGAPADAHYLTTHDDTADLPNSFSLGALSAGLIKISVAGSVATPATAVPGTDYTTPTGTENLDNKTMTGATLTSPTINTGVSGSAIDNDATLAANSATKLATQQAVKSYVDSVAQGLSAKRSVLAATAAALPANTYANGTSGVGATITANANGALTIDGQSIALNDRVLIKDESSASHNGIYVCTTAGSGGAAFVLTRATDFDLASEIPGAYTFVENGTVNNAVSFIVADPGPFTIGTTAIDWTQFSRAEDIQVTTPLSKTGNTIGLTTPLGAAYGGLGAVASAFAGLIKMAAGVASVAVAGTDYTTPTGTENLSNKTITASSLIATAYSLLIGGWKGIFTHSNTADRTYTLPDVSGTVALTSDITSPPFVDTQTIIKGSADATKLLRFEVDGFTTGTTRVATLPNYNVSLSPSTTAGDTVYFDGTDNVRLAKGTARQHLKMNAGATAPEWAAGLTVDFQAFTSSGAATWTKPATAVFVDVICVGAGGGGGGGRRSTATSIRGGGGGGSGGAVTRMQWAAGQLGSSESLVVGLGGTPGAAPVVDNNNGGDGGTGGASWFGGTTSTNSKLIAQGGGGGVGGQVSVGGAGGAGQTALSNTYQFYNAGGGVGGTSGTPVVPVNAQWGPGNGGGGGGINASGTASGAAAGSSGSAPAYGSAVSGGGGTAGTTSSGTGGAGAAGTTNGTSVFVFGAGGGGGAPDTTIGRSGGNGGLPGGGGGGAGATLNGNNGFPGGTGADGAVIVISYCY